MRCPTCRSEFDSGTRCPFDGALLISSDQMDPFIGRTLDGRYRIDRRIGEGATAIVFKGRDTTLDRDVAIKILRTQSDEELVARFRREAQVVQRLASPNTVEVYGYGADGTTTYIAMEYLEGTPLDVELKKGRIDPARTLFVMREVCRALEEAHALGMIHRDLKPANIFIDRKKTQEVVKVLDFGIAKVTAQKSAMGNIFAQRLTTMGAVMGTPIYMSPEQARDEELDARTDLYALGVVAYHCLSGRPPFDGAPGQVIFEHTNKAPPPLPEGLDPALSSLVLQLLEKTPAARPASATEVRIQIDRMLAGQATRPSRGKGRWVIGLATLALVVAAGAFSVVRLARAPASAAPRPSSTAPPGFFDVPIDE